MPPPFLKTYRPLFIPSDARYSDRSTRQPQTWEGLLCPTRQFSSTMMNDESLDLLFGMVEMSRQGKRSCAFECATGVGGRNYVCPVTWKIALFYCDGAKIIPHIQIFRRHRLLHSLKVDREHRKKKLKTKTKLKLWTTVVSYVRNRNGWQLTESGESGGGSGR